jgi:membrane-associated phospholipid phosphatase
VDQIHEERRTMTTYSWALARGLRQTCKDFRESWLALPAGAFTRWLTTLLNGLVLCALLTWAITRDGRQVIPTRLGDWDRRTLLEIEQGPISFQNAILAESPGNLSYLIPLTAVAAVIAARSRRPLLSLTFLASYVLARPIIFFGWSLWDRPRPDFIASGLAAPPLHSYPSGHVILALGVYGLLAHLWSRASRSWLEKTIAWTLLALWVTMIGVARLRLGSHWATDVLAAIPIGAAWLITTIIALNRGERRPNP